MFNYTESTKLKIKAINHWLTGVTLFRKMTGVNVCMCTCTAGLKRVCHYRKQDGGEPCVSNTLDPSLFQPSLPHTGPVFLKVQYHKTPACLHAEHPLILPVLDFCLLSLSHLSWPICSITVSLCRTNTDLHEAIVWRHDYGLFCLLLIHMIDMPCS